MQWDFVAFARPGLRIGQRRSLRSCIACLTAMLAVWSGKLGERRFLSASTAGVPLGSEACCHDTSFAPLFLSGFAKLIKIKAGLAPISSY